MSITFSDFDNNGYMLELDVDTLAKITDIDAEKLSGLFGAGNVGTVRIGHEEDVSLEDYLSDVTAPGEAVGPARESDRKWRIPTSEDASDSNVAKILAARESLQHRYEDTDNDREYGYRVLTKYAAILGYRYEIDQLQNYNDFATVYTITPADRDENCTVHEYKEIFTGNVFFVEVEVRSPIKGGETFTESIGGYVGEAYVIEAAQNLVTDAVRAIQQQAREVLSLSNIGDPKAEEKE